MLSNKVYQVNHLSIIDKNIINIIRSYYKLVPKIFNLSESLFNSKSNKQIDFKIIIIILREHYYIKNKKIKIVL